MAQKTCKFLSRNQESVLAKKRNKIIDFIKQVVQQEKADNFAEEDH